MYNPVHFREDRPDVLGDAMRAIGFAMLVTQDAEQGFVVNSLPMLFADGVLRGHVARANPVWKSGDGPALAVFLGPHAYVSPGWYPSKAAAGTVVPTWNYITVQARGTIHWIHDAGWLKPLVSHLTETHEAGRDDPWSVSDAPENYIDSMLRAIVGFEIAVTALEGKYKLNQNRDEVDRAGVHDGFAREGRSDIARLMEPR